MERYMITKKEEMRTEREELGTSREVQGNKGGKRSIERLTEEKEVPELGKESWMLMEMMREIRADMKEMREEAQNTKRELMREWEEREDKWEAEKREMLDRMVAVENTVEDMLRKGRASGKDSADEESVESKLKEIRQKLERLESRQAEGVIAEKIKRLDRVLEAQEKKERRKNIIIKGLDTSEQGIKQEVNEFLERDLKIEEKLEWARNVGGRRGKVILARVKDEEAREEIMKKKSGLSGRKVFIDHDLTKREREIQRELVEIMRVEKSNGRKTEVGYQKIWIEGE